MGRRIKSVGVVMLGVVVISLVFGVSQALAQDLSTLIKEAQEMQAKFEEEVKDMTVAQEMVSAEEKMSLKSKLLRKGNKFRMESKMQMPEAAEAPPGMEPMETIIIYDGKDTWMISSFMGKRKLSEEEAKEYEKERYWWDRVPQNAKVVGSERVGGRDCYVVEYLAEVELDEEVALSSRMWLDKKGLTIIKEEAEASTGEKWLLVNSDFRKIMADWEMPYKTQIFEDDELMATSIVKSVETNKGLSDDLFDPDKVELKGPDMQEMMKKMMEEE